MAKIKNTTEIEFVKRKFNFADSVIPTFKKPLTGGIVKYGSKDDYGDYLINLFNKSSKHSAIINGKVVYIFGNGFAPVDATNTAALSFLASANINQYKTWVESISNLIGRITSTPRVVVFPIQDLEVDFSNLNSMKEINSERRERT